ncbi:uncharacterized protein [Ptychodera flava]|uniref:uncharacterized protein n=1 Tax=Ptychodera flava TaxID=63121 RepID=UPI00396A91E3
MASSDVRPSTSGSKGGVPAKRPDGNGGRRGSTTATNTKRSMVKKAVIVCDRWGPSIHGGVTDGLHLAIRLLQNMGISVHCTALQATEEEEREAEEMGVTLHLPTKTGVFEFREPHRDWLLYHNIHFPKLEELANVKFVFGFSPFTSEAAFHITCKVFPKASCYLINLFDKDDITPLIVGCSKEEVEFRKKIMSDEFKNAKCSFSVGERVYARYRRLYRDSNQQLLSPTVFEEYLSPSISEPLPIAKHETFQILSIVQEYEFEDPKKLDVIISAINTVAENLDLLDETPPAWKIIGIPPSKEEEIVEKLQRSPALKITPTYVTTTEGFNRELFSSHLVLIPPSSTSYANLTLAAMCAAIPIFFPRRSHSHEIVDEHFRIVEAQELAVDMDRDPAGLAKRITSVKRNNPTALERAKKIRQHIKEKVAGDLQSGNKDFITTLSADMQAASSEKNETVREAKTTVEQKDRESSTVEDVVGTAEDTENIPSTSSNQESKGKDEKSQFGDQKSRTTGRKDKEGTLGDKRNTAKEQRHREYRSLTTQALGDGEGDVTSSHRKASTGRNRRQEKQEEAPAMPDRNKVRPDGVIPQEGKKVREVSTAFYSNKQTKKTLYWLGNN